MQGLDYYGEMNKLIKILAQDGIPFEVRPFHSSLFGSNTLHVFYPSAEGEIICDIVCHEHSYGSESGLMELMGLNTKGKRCSEPVGYLNAYDAYDIIKKYHKNQLTSSSKLV